MTSVLGANFPVKDLSVLNCTFENIESECFMINQPHQLRISECVFMNCQASVVSVKYFEDDTTTCYMTPKERKTSTFATTMKSDHFQSVVVLPNNREILSLESTMSGNSHINLLLLCSAEAGYPRFASSPRSPSLLRTVSLMAANQE